MKLNKGINKVLLFLSVICLLITSVFAAPVIEKKALNLDEAINMAISKDDALAQYSRSIEVYKEQRKAISDLSLGTYNEKSLLINEAEQNREYRKDAIMKDVTEQYQNVILLQKNIDLLKQQITLNEKQVKQTYIKKEKGFCDALTYEKAVQDLETVKKNKVQTEEKLEDVKQSFLKLTNINLDQYILQVDYMYEPFVLEGNISSYASGMATKLVKYTEERIQLSEENFWEKISTAGVGGTAPTYDVYLEQKVALQNSKEKAKSVYDTYKLLIETRYTALNGQLDTIKAKESEYKTSVKEILALEIKYKAGYISTLNYETQKFDLEAKQLAYLNEIYNYNIMKIQIEKPWTMNEYGF